MWCSELRAAAAVALVVLAGCGFQPLYGPGTPAAGMTGQVLVTPMPDENRPQFAMRERLSERLGDPAAPAYRLEVDLTLTTRGVALTEQDYTTRYNVAGTADYRLIPVAGGPPVASGRVQTVTGYSAPQSVTSSAFASLVAGQDAERRVAVTLADQIVMRLAVTAGTWDK